MRRATPASLHDRQDQLERLRQEAEAEELRLVREEASLRQQVREAAEQLRYYEGLLVQLRRDWGGAPALTKLLKRLD